MEKIQSHPQAACNSSCEKVKRTENEIINTNSFRAEMYKMLLPLRL